MDSGSVHKYTLGGCCSELLQTRWLKTTKIILLSSGVEEFGNQGVCRSTLPLKALEESSSLPPPAFGGSRCSLACRCIRRSLPPSSHHLSVSLCPFLSLIRTLPLNLAPTLLQKDLTSSPTSITSAKTPFPKKVTFTGPRVRTSIYLLDDTGQPITMVVMWHIVVVRVK